MRRRWTLQPEIASAIGPLPFNVQGLNREVLPEIRDAMRASAAPPDSTRHQVITVDRGNDAPGLDLHVFTPNTPSTARRSGLYWIHGGGYFLGSAADEGRRVANWVEAGYVVVSPEYRLGPEHPYPAALVDSLDGLLAARDRAAELGIRPDKVVLAGGSAGGGLAAALSVWCRDLGLDAVSHLVLIAPMIDDRTELADDVPLAVWTRETNRFGWSSYLGDRIDAGALPRYAAIARVTDLSGLPPTTIVVGGSDMFAVESLDLAARLLRDGVPVDCHVYAGLPHGFDALAPQAADSAVLVRDVFESLERAARFDE